MLFIRQRIKSIWINEWLINKLNKVSPFIDQKTFPQSTRQSLYALFVSEYGGILYVTKTGLKRLLNPSLSSSWEHTDTAKLMEFLYHRFFKTSKRSILQFSVVTFTKVQWLLCQKILSHCQIKSLSSIL